MEASYLLELLVRAVIIVLELSLPPIIVASVVGVGVSLFQALTQIQEQTVSFAIKLVAVILTTLLIGSWMGQGVFNFAFYLFENFPQLVK